MKFLIQLLAASVCAAYSRVDDGDVLGRDLVYFTYGLDGFADEIQTFMTNLHASPQLFEPCKFVHSILPIFVLISSLAESRKKKGLFIRDIALAEPLRFSLQSSILIGKLLDCIINYPIKSGRGDIVALRSNKSLLDYVGASFGFANASHSNSLGSLSLTDTQSSTFDTFSWSDNEDYNTPEPEPLSD